MKLNGKDYPMYYGKKNMFQTTNQIRNFFHQIQIPRSSDHVADLALPSTPHR
jgi:hypothetical protein